MSAHANEGPGFDSADIGRGKLREMGGLGRGLMVAGALLLLLGLALVFLERIPGFRPGKLPGDISITKGNWRFYFPLGTSLLVSLLLTLVIWLFSRR